MVNASRNMAYKYTFDSLLLILLSIYPEMKLLDHIVILRLISWGAVTLFRRSSTVHTGLSGSQVAQWWSIHPPAQKTREMWVQSWAREGPLEEDTAAPSSVLPWRIPWMEEPGGLQSLGSQRAGRDWAAEHPHPPALHKGAGVFMSSPALMIF